jgi:hypothetical protein
MPYIERSERAKYDDVINQIIRILNEVSVDSIDGELNYLITKIFKDLYEPRYFNYNRAIGVLESVKQEFYRRVVAPYEDNKIIEKGDIE